MAYRLTRRLFLPLLGVSALAASEFWKDEAPAQWTEEEVKLILTDSPWAREANPRIDRPALYGLRGPLGEIGGGMGRGGGERGVRGELPNGPETKLIIRWASALPIRQALRWGRDRVKPGQPPNADGTEADDYVIEVLGFAARYARMSDDRIREELHATTCIKRKNKDDLLAEKIEVNPVGRVDTFVYRFPKDDPIRLEEKEVEFVSGLGAVTFKEKFKLSEMLYRGKLAL
jgi:hypothetical protein